LGNRRTEGERFTSDETVSAAIGGVITCCRRCFSKFRGGLKALGLIDAE